jgi:hypothetical protein
MQILPDGFRWTSSTVVTLIQGAYGTILDSQIESLPDWARTERYWIEGKVDATTAEAWKASQKIECRRNNR